MLVSFWGSFPNGTSKSIGYFNKLDNNEFLCIFLGSLKSDPLLLPGRHALNAGLALSNLAAMGYFLYDPSYWAGMSMLGTTAALSSVMGVTLTAAIGGKEFRS